MSIGRLTAIVILLAATAAVGRSARSADRIVDANLSALSYTVGGWKGTDGKPLDAKSVDELGADAYLTREYSAGAGAPIGVYIAFYGAQRPGVSVHSPLHCLPGTGWEPLDVRTLDVSSREAGASGVNLRGAGAPGVNKVRRLVVRKNRDRAVVLYWYAVHGRVIAGEAISKLWLLHDSIRLGRSDAALVRIVVPVTESVEASERRGLAFTRDLLPYLSQLWS
ncbi:MAG TPA: EpsI family protein [Vicinamibacterales bacterium]|nr:EpsI family protein [Vicinamibacterales bacterium]